MFFGGFFKLFLVVLYSCVGSAAHAVVKGATENATWIGGSGADAVFGAVHSSNTHQLRRRPFATGVSIRIIPWARL